MAYVPVTGPIVVNTHGSPNQGTAFSFPPAPVPPLPHSHSTHSLPTSLSLPLPTAGAFIPAGALGGVASGFVTSQHGEKGHHTVVHPVIVQQAPPPPQTIIHEVVKEVPVAVPTPQSPPQPVNIHISNTTPNNGAQGTAGAPVLPQRPAGTTTQQTTTTTTTGM